MLGVSIRISVRG